jgi:hypothetical protein
MTTPLEYARILVKPDGVTRTIAEDEATRAIVTWNGLLDHLSAEDSSTIAPHELVSQLPGKIERRVGYRPGYDLQAWRSLANSAPRCHAPSKDIHDFRGLLSAILTSLDMRCAAAIAGWLAPHGVQALYASSRWFAEDPHALVSYLTTEPVVLEHWHGPHLELTLAVKFAVRWALGAEGRRNLVHCDLITRTEYIGSSATGGLLQTERNHQNTGFLTRRSTYVRHEPM